jgi:hypothetical protein
MAIMLSAGQMSGARGEAIMNKLLFSAAILLQVSTLHGQTSDSGFPLLEGPYLGQERPGETPEVFAPGVVSTPAHEFSCSLTADGKEFYFARRHPELDKTVVMVTKLRDGRWTEPAVAPFVENQFSFEPMVTPDSKRLYFMSGRPIPGQAGPPMNIFYVEREGDGWGVAKNAGPPFNPARAMFVSMAANGTIYTTDISEGPGTESIAVSRQVDGKYRKLVEIGPPVNAGAQNMYPFIAPDESYLVYAARRPSERIKSVLLVSFRKPDGGWGEPRVIDLGVEAGLPFVSRDGEFLFFTSGERGKSDIYWVTAGIIEELRPGDPE